MPTGIYKRNHKGIYKKCLNCDKKFYCLPHKINEKKFCSVKCHNEKMKSGIHKPCLICNKEIYVKNFEKNNNRYCSRECYYKGILGRSPPHKNKTFEEFYGKEKANKIKQKISINNSGKRTGIYNKCKICNKEFYSYPYELKINKGKFCSKNCFNKYQKENPLLGINNPNYKSKIINNCKICNKEFEVIPSQKFIKYCSIKCRQEAFNKKPPIRLGTGKIRYCKDCGEKLIKYVERCDDCNKKHCSFIRKEKWKEENYRKIKLKQMERIWKENSLLRSGKNHPLWLGGKSFEPYNENFNNNFKNFIRKRDNQICINCGKHREKLKRALHIHHIDYNKLNSIEQNCISLCNSCHVLTNYNREYWKKLFQDKLSKLYNYKYSDNGDIILNLDIQQMKGGF